MPKSIAIITNEYSSEIFGTNYYLGLFAEVWRQQGILVHVTAGCNYIPADIAILHVDTTIVDDRYLELAARYPVAINGRVKDISKSRISRQLLERGDSYAGQVIVKTDANAGGAIEFGMGIESSNSIYNASDSERPWRKREFLDSYKYPVFDNIKDVPPGVWRNKKLIVEKFLPERLENGDYMHRCYLFFGKMEVATWFAAPVPVVKGSISTSRGLSDHIPKYLREIREDSDWGYARFDYTEVDGDVFLFDMNKTPVYSDRAISIISEEMIQAFANAISDFE